MGNLLPSKILAQPKAKSTTDTSFQKIKAVDDEEWMANNLTPAEEEPEGERFYPSLLQSVKDPLQTAAMFDWASFRFRWRGILRQPEYRVNGALITMPFSQQYPWYIFNGLGAQLRTTHFGSGIDPVDFSLGNTSGARQLSARAADYPSQFSMSGGYASRNSLVKFGCTFFHHQPVRGFSWGTALQLAYQQPTLQHPRLQQSVSFLLMAEKKYAAQKSIYGMFCFTPQLQSKSSAITQEVFQISGNSNYNPNWGWQGNQMRMAATRSYQYPALLITHESLPNPYTLSRWSIALISGFQADRGIDSYQAPDPRPDYYRYLPAYVSDSLLQLRLSKTFQQQPDLLQMSWQRLYATNQQSWEKVFTGNPLEGRWVSGLRSRYVLEERRAYHRIASLNYFYHTLINGTLDFVAGASWQWSATRFRKKLIDLLGGDFYLNVNGFVDNALLQNPLADQNNLDEKNGLVLPGDFFGYDYGYKLYHTEYWFQLQQAGSRWDWFLGARYNTDRYNRIGYVTNGLYPIHSSGTSASIEGVSYYVKGGITYKLQGNHFFNAQMALQTFAPLPHQVYLHPQWSDATSETIENEQAQLAELSWVYRNPTLSSKVSFFYGNNTSISTITSFYGDIADTWVNHVVTGMATQQLGLEWSGSWAMGGGWDLEWAACSYRVVYSGSPSGKLYAEQTEKLLSTENILTRGYRVGGSPQQALKLAIQYRSDAGWMGSLSFQHLSNRWISLQYLRRTPSMLLANPVIAQEHEKLSDQFFIHAMLGYQSSIRFGKGVSKQIRLFFSARNLLMPFFMAGGFEQARWLVNPSGKPVFPNKYFITNGNTFSATLQCLL